MQRNHLAAVVMTLLAAGFAASAAAQTTAKDHPLISRYPGSEIKVTFGKQEYRVAEFDEIVLPMGAYQKGKFTKTERVEGKVTRFAYVNPRGRSNLEIFRNYQQALTKGGFQTLFACSAAECGDASTALNEPTPDLGYWCVNSSIQCPEPKCPGQ